MPETREPRTSITLPVSAVELVDKLPADHPAFAGCGGKCGWPRCDRCRLAERCAPSRSWRTGATTVNRSARLEALAYAAADRVASPKPARAPKTAKKPKGV